VNTLLILAAALPIVFSAGATTVGSYSGHFPLAVTQSHHFNGKHCLILTDNGRGGFPNSGYAVLSDLYNTGGGFQIIGNTLLVTLSNSSGGNQVGLVFSAPASSGFFGVGVYDDVYSGSASDVGKVVFGTKGGAESPFGTV